MKRIFIMFAICATASSAFAQDCTQGQPFFTFSDGTRSQEIHTLGSDPEFPFLRNLSTPQQVYAAIKKNENRENYRSSMARLNKKLMAIGYENGIKDLKVSDITAANIPSGSEGNMGSGKMAPGYYKLTGDPTGYKAWKITSASGCYVYFMSKCGNSFYPNANAGQTACVSAPVNVMSEPKEITVNSTPAAQVTDKTYVYYHAGRHKFHHRYVRPEIADNNPSKPLLLSSVKRVEANPETYKITVSAASDKVTVCNNKPVDVNANIDVEQISSYTGNYPTAAQGDYKEVSRHNYKRSVRKMRKVERKEDRVSKITGVPVVNE